MWCDYSGPVPQSGHLPKDATTSKTSPKATFGTLPSATVGIACFDHPKNTGDDTFWHVRNDGWMGACFNLRSAREISSAKKTLAHYRIESHAGDAARADVASRYRTWRRRAR